MAAILQITIQIPMKFIPEDQIDKSILVYTIKPLT